MTADITKQELLIDDLPTTSVTIYPSRALVVRDIKLQPGLNEVTIYGITPAADEHSVQVDGHGAATITDMSVELIPNRERFDDQFPDDDSDSEFEDFQEHEYARGDLRILSDELKHLREKAEEATEKRDSANDQLRVLNSFMESINAKHNEPESASKAIMAYGDDRARIHEQWAEAKKDHERLMKLIQQKYAKLQREGKEERKLKKKQKEEKEKKKVLQQRENERMREEKAKFWPKKVYCVKLTLETSTDTPTSSRRVSSEHTEAYPQLSEKVSTESEGDKTVRLSLSYVVREVSWSPRYNVSISSRKKTATVTYSAEFTNKTSETWKDAKVTLSTSQTSYSGLDDTVPELRPWPITLRDKQSYDEDDDSINHRWNTKFSPQENLAGPGFNLFRFGQDNFNRFELFGPEDSNSGFATAAAACAGSENAPQSRAHPAFGASGFGNLPHPATGSTQSSSTAQGFGGGLFGSTSQPVAGNNDAGVSQVQSAGLFGRSSNTAQPTQSGGLFGNTNNQQPQVSRLFGGLNISNQQPTASSLFGASRNTTTNTGPTHPNPFAQPSLFGHPAPTLHEETTWEDAGLTTSYDLPSTRTLAPSSLARRHKVATIALPDAALSYIAVPKLRKGAFLRAKLRNPAAADITLLKGPAGLTLDGTFLGNTTLPRTSPGEEIELDLGVDPALHVTYAAPTVQRSTQGLLAREGAERYARCVGIRNTRGARVTVEVLDQVPVSEQERLRVEVLVPRGLVKGGAEVRAGEPGEEKDEKDGWGKATAVMKEGGKVVWTVELEAGKGCKLPLEWEVRMPADKRIAFA